MATSQRCASGKRRRRIRFRKGYARVLRRIDRTLRIDIATGGRPSACAGRRGVERLRRCHDDGFRAEHLSRRRSGGTRRLIRQVGVRRRGAIFWQLLGIAGCRDGGRREVRANPRGASLGLRRIRLPMRAATTRLFAANLRCLRPRPFIATSIASLPPGAALWPLTTGACRQRYLRLAAALFGVVQYHPGVRLPRSLPPPPSVMAQHSVTEGMFRDDAELSAFAAELRATCRRTHPTPPFSGRWAGSRHAHAEARCASSKSATGGRLKCCRARRATDRDVAQHPICAAPP